MDCLGYSLSRTTIFTIRRINRSKSPRILSFGFFHNFLLGWFFQLQDMNQIIDKRFLKVACFSSPSLTTCHFELSSEQPHSKYPLWRVISWGWLYRRLSRPPSLNFFRCGNWIRLPNSEKKRLFCTAFIIIWKFSWSVSLQWEWTRDRSVIGGYAQLDLYSRRHVLEQWSSPWRNSWQYSRFRW